MTARLKAGAAAACLVLAACGSGTTPAEEVPELAEGLQQVDEALAAEDFDRAEEELATLVDLADAAHEDGELDAVEADRIVAAAQRLSAQLPEPPVEPVEPAQPVEPEAEIEEEDEPGNEDEDEGDESEPEKGPEESKQPSGKGKGKGKEKDD